MKKTYRVLAAALAVIMLCFALAACKTTKGNDVSTGDGTATGENGTAGGTTGETDNSGNEQPTSSRNETTPLVIASDPMDGVFNPFFYTTGADGSVVGLTQLSMMSVDNQGKNPKCGADVDTVALDFLSKVTDTRADKNDDTDYENYYTTYEFLIKNGLKFSDGSDLTIEDVLFNMYMYLDPVYTGSSTMYSVNIKGLTEYRTQEEDPNQQSGFEEKFEDAANARIQAILDWADDNGLTFSDLAADVLADIATVEKLFREELEADWTTAGTNLASYKEEYPELTEVWQAYFYMYGYIKFDSETKKFDPASSISLTETRFTTKETAVDYLYSNFLDRDVPETYKTKITEVLTRYQTATTAHAAFATEAKSEYFRQMTESGKLRYDSVSGITTYKTTDFNGQHYDEEHDVLRIVINGVDPKAVWNFSFSVAPMNYYIPESYRGNKNLIHGVSYGDSAFFTAVKSNHVPMGAGPYKAVDANGNDAKSASDFFSANVVYFQRNDNFLLGKPKIKMVRYQVISSTQLMDAVTMQNNQVHISTPNATLDNKNEIESKYADKIQMVMNDTLGYGYIGINANYVQDLAVRKAIMYAMDTKLTIDFYSQEMASTITRPMSKLSWAYPTDKDFAYRLTNAAGEFDREATKAKIIELVEDAGYRKVNGIYQRTSDVTGKVLRLEFTFTLAGESINHPAYSTFEKAKGILEECGFKINIVNDPNALVKLAGGTLTVWAAAWSSTIDPDMYQVYHKKSTATSVNNWGYPWLLQNGSSEERAIIDDLSDLIEQGRATTDIERRKEIYAQALDKVMELCVELPTYQRKDMYIIDKTVVDINSLPKEITPYNGPLSEIWNLSLR